MSADNYLIIYKHKNRFYLIGWQGDMPTKYVLNKQIKKELHLDSRLLLEDIVNSATYEENKNYYEHGVRFV